MYTDYSCDFVLLLKNDITKTQHDCYMCTGFSNIFCFAVVGLPHKLSLGALFTVHSELIYWEEFIFG